MVVGQQLFAHARSHVVNESVYLPASGVGVGAGGCLLGTTENDQLPVDVAHRLGIRVCRGGGKEWGGRGTPQSEIVLGYCLRY